MPISYVATGDTKLAYIINDGSAGGSSFWESELLFSEAEVPGSGDDWIVWFETKNERRNFSGGTNLRPTGTTVVGGETIDGTGASGRTSTGILVHLGRRRDLTWPARFYWSDNDSDSWRGLRAITPVAVRGAGADPNIQIGTERPVLPSGQSPITVTQEAFVLSGHADLGGAYNSSSIGYLFSEQSTPDANYLDTANLTPGVGAIQMIPDLDPDRFDRVRPLDHVVVLISSDAADAKTFALFSSAGTCTRRVNTVVGPTRIQMWTCPRYSGAADDWANWSGRPIITSAGGTGTPFVASVMAARGQSFNTVGSSSNYIPFTWQSTPTPNFPPEDRMPGAGTSTRMILGVVTWGTPTSWAGPTLDTPNGWSRSDVSVLPRSRFVTNPGTGVIGTLLPPPGFTNVAGLGPWHWIPFQVTGAPRRIAPGPVTINPANGFTLRKSEVFPQTPPEYAAANPQSANIDRWRQHAFATRIAPAGQVVPPVWNDGMPPSNFNPVRVHYTVALYEVFDPPPPSSGIYRDGRIYL